MAMYVEARGLISDAALPPDADRISDFTALCPLRAGFHVGRLKHGLDNAIGLCRRTRATNVSETNDLGCLFLAAFDIP
jgi:hypothetical protein